MKDDKILVVEDEDHLSRLLVDLFQLEGYWNIQIANNGHTGVEKYKENRPQIVLMDLEMPIMNGYDSSKQIKKHDPRANILLITANPWSPFAQKTLEEGYASQIIPKPFRLDELLEAVRKSLGSAPPPH